MDVRNCRKCGKLFNYVMGPITCPQCRDKLEEKFQEVKAYVFDHEGCDIQEVSEACDVTPQQIKQWLRETEPRKCMHFEMHLYAKAVWSILTFSFDFYNKTVRF